MRLSFKTANSVSGWESLREMWHVADQIKVFDAGWIYDHLYGIEPSGPALESWTLLGSLAADTKRLRMGVMVTGNTFRHPAVLAKMAATVDIVSGGRLEIGLGSGWYDEEHRAYGIPLPPVRERMDRLEEACEIIHLLLTEETVSFNGIYYQLEEAHCEPKPVQRPRPPLVIGGHGEQRTLRIAARWADQWNFIGTDEHQLRHKIAVLHRHCEEVGREPAEIEVSVQIESDKATAHTAARLAAAGAGHIIVYFRPPFRPEVLARTAEALADAVL